MASTGDSAECVRSTVSTSPSRRLPDDPWSRVVTSSSPVYVMLAVLAESALPAIDDPESPAAARVTEMARFYRFLEVRLPELMAEWETIRTAE
ncbi:hypothetical protein [Compostimonas suwonensis]|uniref:Uncharacterized protein n=1 Tax=Compostimonas suwonensis TaxID=1048394 RepID=A0A2M9C4X6_9MICO|nr:hypothetical protein [Compostimonas suwonensis]PJJ65583.1 hypothetical protein CLV54_0616 [Compostimonas suwonensis]